MARRYNYGNVVFITRFSFYHSWLSLILCCILLYFYSQDSFHSPEAICTTRKTSISAHKILFISQLIWRTQAALKDIYAYILLSCSSYFNHSFSCFAKLFFSRSRKMYVSSNVIVSGLQRPVDLRLLTEIDFLLLNIFDPNANCLHNKLHNLAQIQAFRTLRIAYM